MRHWGRERAMRHVPDFAKSIVEEYNENGKISQRYVVFSTCCIFFSLGEWTNPFTVIPFSMQSCDESSISWKASRHRFGD